jgi:hypothetical protein
MTLDCGFSIGLVETIFFAPDIFGHFRTSIFGTGNFGRFRDIGHQRPRDPHTNFAVVTGHGDALNFSKSMTLETLRRSKPAKKSAPSRFYHIA